MNTLFGRKLWTATFAVALLLAALFVTDLSAFAQGLSAAKKAEVDELTKQMKVSPGDYSLWAKRGFIYKKAGEDKLAEADFNEAVRLDPHWAQGHFFLAEYQYDRRELSDCLTNLNLACRIYPDKLSYLKLRGVVLQKLNENMLAIDDFSRVIELEPDYAPAYFLRACSRHDLSGPCADVQLDLQRILVLKPDDQDAKFFLKLVQQEMSQHKGVR